MKFKIDWFLVGMALAVAAAWMFPAPGASGGFLQPQLLTKAGVALIFFLHGLSLSFTALKAGTLKWKLHLVVQTCTFVFFPLLGLGLLAVFGRLLPADLRLGFFYLCVLPSTVSSSVALTAAAGGNVAAAVFNATLSSVLGIFITPLWVGWMLHTAGNPMPLGPVILDLVVWLLLPLTAGQLARPWFANWAASHKPLINRIDRGTILLLVYTSFCESFKTGVWSGQGFGMVLITIAGAFLMFYVVLWASGAACDALKFAWPDRIAAVFCGSKKTLASGVPMAQLIFGAHPGLSFILLPIMIYHPLQLILCAGLASRWASRE